MEANRIVLEAWFMHPKASDVCIRYVEVDLGPGEPVGKAYEWWNLGYVGAPWWVQDAIKPRNFDEWVEITEYVHTPRVHSGLPGPYQVRY